MAALVKTYGGKPIVAPALREVPLESNPQAIAFADALIRGQFDVVILLTGVGTRALLDVVGGAGKRDEFVAALAETRVVPRGPKPLSVMRELGLPPWVMVPEPNTWREILAAIDTVTTDKGLDGLDVAVQEYGVSNPDLVKGLEARGARVTSVPVYRWALPDDVEPLRAAVSSVARGEVDVAIFTTGMQVVHLFQVAGMMQLARRRARRVSRHGRRLHRPDNQRGAAAAAADDRSRSVTPEDGLPGTGGRRTRPRAASNQAAVGTVSSGICHKLRPVKFSEPGRLTLSPCAVRPYDGDGVA